MIIAQHQGYEEFPTLVGTIMTNQAIVECAENNKKTFIRAKVGERNIIEKLIEHQAMLGAETCGHITMMDHAFCSDGIFAALLFFDTITAQPALLEMNCEKYPQVHISVPLHHKTIDNKAIHTVVSKYQDQTSRVIVRKSNTEPVLRIMVEDKDQQVAQKVATELQQTFLEIIK